MNSMPTVKLFVRDLDADGEERLVRAMLAVDGVFGAVASWEERCLEVDFEDDVVALDDLLGTAQHAGFTARIAG